MSDYDDFEEELVGDIAEQRNWRGIFISLLVIAVVFGLVLSAIVLITPKVIDENLGEKLTFKDFIQHKFDPWPFDPVWSSDDKLIYNTPDGTVLQYDCSENDTTEVMNNSTFRELDTDDYQVSADGEYVLLPYNIYYIYRYSYVAKYRIYDVKTTLHVELVGPEIDGRAEDNDLQFVTWSTTGHSLILVVHNNIYYLNSWTTLKDIQSNQYIGITSNGYKDAVFNGIPDWLYEEEILQSANAIWQNADGSGMVYACFDDRGVQRYDMTIYGPLHNKYVENRRLPYPRPDTPNPSVEVKYFDFSTNSTTTFNPPSDFLDSEYYLSSITWKDSNHVAITWLNRPQNVSIISICDTKKEDCIDSYRIEAETGWLDMSQPVVFPHAGDEYFIITSQRDGEFGSFKHIAKIDASSRDKGTRMFVTSGRMEVKKILNYDNDTNTIYFLGVHQDDPREKHLYSATTLQNADDFRHPRCLSCGFSEGCLFVDASFSPNSKYFVLNCNGPDVPYHQLMATPFTPVMMLNDNLALREVLVGKALPIIDFVEIETEDGHVLWGKLLLPAILKKEEIIKYNLLMKVYGSPGTQMVTHEYSVDWEHYQCSAHGLIIAYVDARGSGGRGDAWTHAIYKRLGTVEVADTIAAAQYIKSLHYVHDQAAIYGISHGGYLSASVLGNIDNVFQCGIAIAPVTDWRYYDSFYTEKFMGFPTQADNIRGYNRASVSEYAYNFRKSKFMLIHGTGDDNVHFKHSAQLIKVLTEHDVYFKTQIYTDQQHWLNGGNTRNHLYNTMEDFIFRCLGKTPPREVPEVVYIEDEEE